MRIGNVTGQRQAVGVEDTGFRSHGVEQALGFKSQQAAIGALPQGAIEQQNARLVIELYGSQAAKVWKIEYVMDL
ncbi:MAG: hypothetical protein ABS75_31890 [Pelagibacterium sp. SCN 63-23]|nr:MAG: hypothetical protein ABS75_31890 [Pelagibacterium sp. SCN 63-23]